MPSGAIVAAEGIMFCGCRWVYLCVRAW